VKFNNYLSLQIRQMITISDSQKYITVNLHKTENNIIDGQQLMAIDSQNLPIKS